MNLTEEEKQFIGDYGHFLEGFCRFEDMDTLNSLKSKGFVVDGGNRCIKSLKIKWTDTALDYIKTLESD